MKRQTEMHDRI